MHTRSSFGRISLARLAAHCAVALALTSATIACGPAAPEDADQESAGALTNTSREPDVGVFRSKIDHCKAESDASRRRSCFTETIDTEVYIVNMMDTYASGKFDNAGGCTKKADFSNNCFGQTTQIFDDVREYRINTAQLCNMKAGLPAKEHLGPEPGDAPAIQACSADRELDLANVFLQIFYDDPMVKTDAALAKACPRPELKPPMGTSGRPAFDAQVSDWKQCLTSAFLKANVNNAIKQDVLTTIADATVKACWGPAHGEVNVWEERREIKAADCWAVSLTLMQQTLDKKY